MYCSWVVPCSPRRSEDIDVVLTCVLYVLWWGGAFCPPGGLTCRPGDTGESNLFISLPSATPSSVPASSAGGSTRAGNANRLGRDPQPRRTRPVTMLLSGNHHELIQFHILDQPNLPLSLEFLWLRRHNPHIDWENGNIREWGVTCHSSCLKHATPSHPALVSNPDS